MMFGFGTTRKKARPAKFPSLSRPAAILGSTRAPLRIKTREMLVLGGREIPYTLTVSALARGVRLKISPMEGLEVVVPRRYGLSAVPRLIHQKEDWIIKHLAKLENQKKSSASRLRDGEILRLFGEPYTLRFLSTIQKKPSVKEGRSLKFNADYAEETGKEILIYSRALRLADAAQSGESAAWESAKREFENFCRKKARRYFGIRVPEIAKIMGVNFGRITVRGQSTRWGSCSRENNLNFNWRLAFYEHTVADYVIYHELAHTVHHNHSSRFYALLERFCPDYKVHRKKLREGVAPL